MSLNKFTQEVINTNDFAWALSECLESWDAKNELSLEFLRRCSIIFLAGLYRACMEVALPKAMTVGR